MREHRSIVGTYGDRNTANEVIDELKQQGFSARHIELFDGVSGRDGATRDRLMSWGLPDADARGYAEEVEHGRTLVVLDARDDQVNEAVRIMRHEGGAARERTGIDGERTELDGEEVHARVPIVEEELHVGKERVKTGGVRIVRRTSERPVAADVELREEHVQVERHPVDRPATRDDLKAAREETIELTESEERPVVAKSARVVEEVEIGKTASTRTEHVEDTVRREDVEIENVEGIEGMEGKDRPEARP